MKSNFKISKYTAAAAIFIALNVGIAFASSESHGAHHEGSIWDLRWYWFNFIIYAGGMYLLLRGQAVRGWAARREAIQNAVRAGEIQLENANNALAAAQKRLAMTDSAAIHELISPIIQDGEREAKRIVEQAQKQAVRIVEQAKLSVAVEQKSHETRLRRQVARTIVARAKERIQNELNADSDRALRSAAVKNIKALVH